MSSNPVSLFEANVYSFDLVRIEDEDFSLFLFFNFKNDASFHSTQTRQEDL